MANPVWPAGLPQSPLFSAFQEDIQSQVVTTQSDQGPTFIRRVTTASSKYQTLAVNITQDQYLNAFLPFFNNTLAGGSLPFDWTDPISGNTATYQFIPGSSSISLSSGKSQTTGFSVSPYRNGQLTLSMTLEQLP